ncbi:vitamin K epoxide reductase family protein [Sanguibacter sp. HDW7]|uniref:vitamin K epoxide reductase family protein n=1 Tax=Sanguibacter sp. HDW7 TaxID=2714931 RepID=UPI00140D9FCE|nr:vitamin K epoxide reductase family protein [Sanguibacter sp. HDW7]QIK83829.1 vitamin K epoxide reductase family protein [Sanguibacter sp. HDW7]
MADTDLTQHDDASVADDAVARPLTDRALGLVLLLGGLVGLVGSAALAIERYLTLVDPSHVPSCSLNALLTCSPAMDSAAGSLFGFPNPYLGLGAFPVVMTIGVLLLVAPGVALPRWFWRAFLAVATAGMALVVFLVWTSVAELRALCPYCMVVWFSTLPVWWYVLVRNIEAGLAGGAPTSVLVRMRGWVLAALYLVLVAVLVVGLGPTLLSTLRG